MSRSRPDPAYIPLAAARLFHLPLAPSCPVQRGKADVQSSLPAGAASLRETGSDDRYTPRLPTRTFWEGKSLALLYISMFATPEKVISRFWESREYLPTEFQIGKLCFPGEENICGLQQSKRLRTTPNCTYV